MTTLIEPAKQRAHKLGIRERDLQRALALFRNLRASAAADKVDPRAVRIALIFGLMADSKYARRKISPKENSELWLVAAELYNEVVRRT